ncbi:MAG: hypothetical protein WC787_02595 [Patescibacteria group bacterium]
MPNEPSATVVTGIDARAGRPWWKLCCGGCCLFLLLVLVGGVFFWRGIGGGRGPQILTQLPSNFPPVVTLYRVEQATSIEYFPGSEKTRTFSALLSPLRFFGSVMMTNGFMDANVSRLQQVDTVTIRWKSLDATGPDVRTYYREHFQRNGFTLDERRDEPSASDILIARRADVGVQILIQDLPDIAGVDMVTVAVDYLNQSN